jgi:iron complex outermembrane receptor protein
MKIPGQFSVKINNQSYGHTPYGTQATQIAQFGSNYALGSNPGLSNYFGYNTDHYDTDFEYLRVQSSLGAGFSLDDIAYTDSYYHHETEGSDPNGTTPNLSGPIYVAGQKTIANNDVTGTSGHSDFRDYGNILRLKDDTSIGTFEAGLWYDYISASAFKYNIDFSQGLLSYTKKPGTSPFSYDYTSGATTVQPYIQATFDVTPWLTLIPGVRVSRVTRTLDATINRSTKLPADFNETFGTPQPSLEAKFKLAPGWTAYGQVARGFLAPPISVFATTELTAITPETTTNYQVGTAYHHGPLSIGADLYDINFNNYIASSNVAGVTLFTNRGGAVFRGIEAEATYALRHDLFVYGNGSLNDATYDNGATVAQSPRQTGVLGAVFDRKAALREDDELFASMLGKFVGPQYGSDAGKVDSAPIKSYNYITLSGAYTVPFGTERVKFGADVFNLANHQGIEGLAGLAGDGVTPLFWTLPGRSVVFSLTVSLNG